MKIFFVITFFFGILSCTIPKEARQFKKNTKDWRKSPIVLEAYSDTPFSGIFLTLRENGKFEHTSSGMLQSFEAGNWTNKSDTIRLSYLDNQSNVKNNRNVIIDKSTSTLIFEGDNTPVNMRLRIMMNRL